MDSFSLKLKLVRRRTWICGALPFSRAREGDQWPLFFLGGVLGHLGLEQAPVGAWFWIFLELLSDEHPVGV